MERWQKNLQIAATGVVVAALIEAATGSERSRLESVARCLLAGGLAFAYTQIVPEAHWGVRSGASFAQLPWVATLESNLGSVRPLELAAWGGLTGWFLKLVHP
ncbi:MAG: hypothetical protein ACRD1Y_14735 [Terriglobales bacterium]